MTSSAIDYAHVPWFPKLGWLATLEGRRLSLMHGHAVETRDRWAVEGVWDAPFAEGNFHRAHLFGSGIRSDEDAIYFVPSSALVDRIFYCEDGGELLVSNSLVILLATTGARLDPKHDYIDDAKAIMAGTDDYDPSFRILHPTIEKFHQLYYKSLVVRDGRPSLERKDERRDFASFEEYRRTLCERLEAICANARDPDRRVPLSPFGTLSTGYDSSAVAALVRDMGVKRFFTFSGAWTKKAAHREFDTAPLAQALQIETVRLDRAPTAPYDELLIRAPTPLGHQPPLLSMARYVEQHAEAACVFTGFHGDVVWDVNVGDSHVTEQLRRRGTSGLDLSELRLKSGFFNVAVPFLFASSIESIVRISRHPEMAPWRLGNTYDRPISRRILEEAGVDRSLFGISKGGIFEAVSRPAHPLLRKRYFDSLARRNLLALPVAYGRLGFDKYAIRCFMKAGNVYKRPWCPPVIRRIIRHEIERMNEGRIRWGRENYRVTLYRWCVEQVAEQLTRAARQAPTPERRPRRRRAAAATAAESARAAPPPVRGDGSRATPDSSRAT